MKQDSAHTRKSIAIKGWITRPPALAFYVLTLTFSWGYWFSLLAQRLHVTPGSGVTHFPGLLGPMLAAIVVTAVLGGRMAMRELFGRMFRLGSHGAFKLALALSPLALGAAGCIVMLALGQPLPAAAAFARFPGLPAPWPLAAVVAAVVLVNGYGEETGWRGFLTERLLPRHGHLRSTLWVALLWSVWHLPLFWLNAGMAALMGPILMGWLFALFCGAFVLAQVYLVTGHCILCVALWHAAFNLLVSSESDTGSFAVIVSTDVMVWGFVVALRWWRRQPCACDLHRASVMDAICTLFHKAGRR